MTFTLYLLRHAKTVPGRIDLEDFERPLMEQGIEKAQKLKDHLQQEQVAFDHVYCSSAVRTRQTLEHVLPDYAGEVSYLRELYHASAQVMLDTLHLTPPGAAQVLMVGHNPGISQLAVGLARRGETSLVRSIAMGYSPCTCATFQFDCASWQEVGIENSSITGLWTA